MFIINNIQNKFVSIFNYFNSHCKDKQKKGLKLNKKYNDDTRIH